MARVFEGDELSLKVMKTKHLSKLSVCRSLELVRAMELSSQLKNTEFLRRALLSAVRVATGEYMPEDWIKELVHARPARFRS